MKRQFVFAMLIIVAFVVSACGGGVTPTAAPPPTKTPETIKPPEPTKTPEPTGPIELRMLWYNDGGEGDVMRALLDKFEKANPNIKVVMDTVAYKDLHNILQAQVEAGAAPDMARITDVARFAGKYLDMRKYMKDPDGWAKNWPAATLQSLRKGDDKTSLNGFPTQFTVTGPFINRTLFEQAGVAVPSDTKKDVTWEEWVEAAKKVAAATNTPYAVAIDRSGHRFWGPSLSKCAVYFQSDGKVKIDSPGFRETANMIIGWHKDKITPLEVWAGGGGGYAAANEFFVNGQLVLYMSGSWQVGQFAKLIGDKFNWQVIPNPSGKCGSTGIPGGAVLVGFGSTKYPAEVTKLMEYLSSDEVLAEFSAKSLFLPGKLTLAKKGIDYPSNKDALNTFLAEIPKLKSEAYALQYSPLTFVINTEIRDRLSQVIVGEITLDEAIQKIQAKVDEAQAALPPPPPPQAGGPVELRMLWYNDGGEGDVMRALLDKFEKANPNIKVVMDTVAYKDLHNILQAQVEAGAAPDMARITDVARFAGKYLDMRKYMKDPDGWAKNWPAATLQSLRKGDDKTSLNGFPTQFTVTGPFINRTLFEQAGVAVPSDTKKDVTWEEWVEAAKQVAKATNTPYAVAIDRTGHRFWGPSLSKCATYIQPDGSFKIDTPGFRETANMIIGWHKDKITPLEVWAGGGGGYAAANEFFVNGQLVLYMSGSWQVGQFAKLIGDKFDWEVIPNPSGKCGSTGIPGGAVLVGFGSTKYPAEVTKLMEYLSSDEVLAEFSAKSLFIPGKLTLAAKGIDYPSNKEALNTFLAEIPKLMPEAYALQYHPLTFVLNTEIRDRLSQVIVGELTLDQAIQKIQTKMDEAVAAQKK